MSEPKWRDLPVWMSGSDAKLRRVIDGINSRMAELFPPAPQPEAKAEPDRVRAAIDRLHRRAVAAAGPSDERWQDAEDDASVIEARIAELARELDDLRGLYGAATLRRSDIFREGAAAAKEACARRLAHFGHENVHRMLPETIRIGAAIALIRETEVPDA